MVNLSCTVHLVQTTKSLSTSFFHSPIIHLISSVEMFSSVFHNVLRKKVPQVGSLSLKFKDWDSSTKLSLLTWNIWFEHLEQHTRFESILSICKDLEPDIICFQEVIPSFIHKVKSSEFFASKYLSSDTNLDGRTVGEYGVMTLCRSNLDPKYSFHSFPTVFDRKLLLTELQFGGEKFAIGNVHLESLMNQPTREKQLEISYNVLKHYKSSVLCGDFNFCSLSNYYNRAGSLDNDCLSRTLPGFTDMWPALKPVETDPGYTFNSRENRMIGDRDERMRFDRICHRFLQQQHQHQHQQQLTGTLSHFVPMHIQRVGNCPIVKLRDGTLKVAVSVDSDCILSSGSDDVDNAETSQNIAYSGFKPPSKTDFAVSSSTSKPVLVVTEYGRLPVPLFPSDHYGLYCEFELATTTADDE